MDHMPQNGKYIFHPEILGQSYLSESYSVEVTSSPPLPMLHVAQLKITAKPELQGFFLHKVTGRIGAYILERS